MKVIITEESLQSLESSLLFYLTELGYSLEKVGEIKTQLIARARSLSKNPYQGQHEPYLKRLGKGHRRLVEVYFKIIYLIEGQTIYITDFFETRQDPAKMQG